MRPSFDALNTLYKTLDQEIGLALERHPSIQCTSGCNQCCKESGSPLVSALEWEHIQSKWETLPQNTQDQILSQYRALKEELRMRLFKGQANTHNMLDTQCMFLIDEKCAIYSFRPLTCRAYGISQHAQKKESVWEQVYACQMEKDRWETELPILEPQLPIRETHFETLSQLDPSPLITLLSYFDRNQRHAP